MNNGQTDNMSLQLTQTNQSPIVMREGEDKISSLLSQRLERSQDFQIADGSVTVDVNTESGIPTLIEPTGEEIGGVHLKGVGEETQDESHSLAHSSMHTKGVLLTALGFFLTVSLSAASNPPALMMMEARQNTAGGAPLGFIDVVTGSMPASFYFMVCNTTVFMATMGAITTVLCFLPCFNVTLFVVFMVLLTYILLVAKAVPSYTVEIGSWSVSNSVLIWISVLVLMCLGVTIVATVKCIRSSIHQSRILRDDM